MMEKSRILIADDHQVVVQGLTAALEGEPDIEIVGSANDGVKALDMVTSLNPDILILDISMPKMNGIEVVERIRKIDDKVRILVFTMTDSRENILTLFRMGISGYILKGEPLEEVLLAIKTMKTGASFYSSAVQTILKNHITSLEKQGTSSEETDDVQHHIGTLSRREREIFLLLADGLTPRKIGDRLCISPKTVETHKYNIMEKLNVASLAQLTKIAVKYKLIEI